MSESKKKPFNWATSLSRRVEKAPEPETRESAPVEINEHLLCPTCKDGGEINAASRKCRLCGARQTVNQVSGNVIWMRNGHIVRAFKDEKDAYTSMATRYGIPRSQWPEDFR